MSSSQAGNSIIWVAVIAVVAGAALIGYGSVQSGAETETAPQETAATPEVHEHDHDHGHAHAATPVAQNDANAKAPTDLSALAAHPDDIIIGDPNAPVRLVEYASLSCPHCASMHLEILPDIKKNYVDTGKAYIAFRHFPLNAPALRAAMVIHCADPAQQPAMLNAFFSRQKEWAFDNNYLANITKIAGEFGVTSDAAEACFKNVELENAMLQSRQVGAALGVTSTPTLYVNDARLDGAVGPDIIAPSIEEALNPTATHVNEAENAPLGGDKPQEITQE